MMLASLLSSVFSLLFCLSAVDAVETVLATNQALLLNLDSGGSLN
jgi:hypothetical protein